MKAEVRKAVTQISKVMHEFMQSKRDAADLFPKEYAEISTQMVEIKSTMRQHEQILKDEANRKNDLIAYLAHDLKTPLTSVIGYLSQLRKYTNKEYIQTVRGVGYRFVIPEE